MAIHILRIGIILRTKTYFLLSVFCKGVVFIVVVVVVVFFFN